MAANISSEEDQPNAFIASICRQMLTRYEFDNCDDEFRRGLVQSFMSFNEEWKQASLWALLKMLLLRIPGPLLLILRLHDIHDRDKASPKTLDVLKPLISLLGYTEKAMKLLLIVSGSVEPAFPLAGTYIFDLDDIECVESVKSDYNSWLDIVTKTRPQLKLAQSDIERTIYKHPNDPAVIVSYLSFLEG